MMEIVNCGRCDEDAYAVELDPNKWFVRVRRSSYCKQYKPHCSGLACKTTVRSTKSDAIREWSEMQKEPERVGVAA